jgi:hypothetical protein
VSSRSTTRAFWLSLLTTASGLGLVAPGIPKQKGKIERNFWCAEKNLLNGRTFSSLEHLN